MKYLYKSTKVVYDAHLKEYQVYYKNWFLWRYDSCYKFDESYTKYPVHYSSKESAEEKAIARAKAMLNTVEVWRGYNL
jgi:hypothetical protein